MSKRKTTEEFVEQAIEVHGNKYDYSEVEYIDANTKVCIRCSDHGAFWLLPNSHLGGQGCCECGIVSRAKINKKTTEQFIKEAFEVHGNAYDYSEVELINNKTKVTINCLIHGAFRQKPNEHLRGYGCCECANEKCSNRLTKTREQFVNEAIEVHGDRYDYSQVVYIDNRTEVCIVCPIHGAFRKTPGAHIHQKQGCQQCTNERSTGYYDLEFIEKHPEEVQKPAILYLIKIYDENEAFYKVGITKRTVEERYYSS